MDIQLNPWMPRPVLAPTRSFVDMEAEFTYGLRTIKDEKQDQKLTVQSLVSIC